MATWFCGACTTEYSVGAPRCPHCLATDPIREDEQLRRENEMAKITVNGGPSNADAVPGQPGFMPTEGETAGGPPKALPDVTDNPKLAAAEKVSEPDYEAWTVDQLKDELGERELIKGGNKDELVLRLLEDDEQNAE